jgi:hypothetical protein
MSRISSTLMIEQKFPARPATQHAATRCQNRKTGSTFAIWSDGCHIVWCRTLISLLTEQYVEVLLKCLCWVKHRVIETCKVVEDQLHALLTSATDAGELLYRSLGYFTNVVYPSAPFCWFGRQQTGSGGTAVFLSRIEPRFTGLLSHRTVPGGVSVGRRRP